MKTDVMITMPDGQAPAYVFTPGEGAGPWPAVIMYTDAMAIRPTFFEMAQTLADRGYYVLLPDMFWRLGPYEPIVPAEIFKSPDGIKTLIETMLPAGRGPTAMPDTGVFLDWLKTQPQARADKVGVVGYCMGGYLAIKAAGTYPDQVAAAAAFHPGAVANDAPDSPHLLAPAIKARVLVGGADNDANFDLAQKERLDAAFKAAGVDADVKIYEGALHGYAPPDMPVYNPQAAARHWREMFALFDGTLK